MNSKILVAYATLSGSTAEVAEAIGETLGKEGAQVDVRPIKEVGDLSPYQAVVVGGPVIIGWHREAVGFVGKHQGALSQVPVAYFMTAINLTKSTEASLGDVPVYQDPRTTKPPQDPEKLSFRENHASVASYLGPVLKKAPQVKPVGAGFFGGKLDYIKLNLLHKLFVMLIIQARPGDFRNWDAIRDWATSLHPALLKE